MRADAGAPRDGRAFVIAPSASMRPVARRRHRTSVVGVLGEILITLGVIVMLFLAWELWIDDALAAGPLRQQAAAQSQKWEKEYTGGSAPASSVGPVALRPGDPHIPVAVAPANAQRWGNLLIPRFGSDFYRPIAQGVGVADVLNKYEVGHYPTTQMPGQNGNVVLASHRTAYGGALHLLHQLHVGDHVYIETVDGWYQYSFRNLEYVKPTGVGVLDPVPQQPGTTATAQMLTLTTCNPFYSTAERIIGYASFDAFWPRADGPPNEIAATVPKGG